MDAGDLQGRFRLGECLIEPRDSRITGPSGTFVLEREQLALLLCLVRSHGESVSHAHLRECAWPQGDGSEQSLRAAIRALREALGGSVKDRRYIVSVGRGDFALVAHFQPLPGASAAQLEPTRPVVATVARQSLIGRLQTFVVELRRRNVLKVGGAYLVGMWIVLQVAETTFEPLRLPDWWMTALTILAVVGLPIVAALAWSYEITPGGIVLDEGGAGGIRLPRARRAIAPAMVLGVALMAAVTGFAWWHTIDRAPPEQPALPRLEPSAQSIAVLPFVDMSPTGEASYLGDGLSEELSSDLAKLPGLRVAARTSSFAYKGRDIDVRSIGSQLGVRYVLEGSVRRDGERVRVTAQLIDSLTGFHTWTESYDRPWQDLIGIQQEISGAIARKLHAVLTPELAEQLRVVPTNDPRAYDFYLAGLSLLRQGGALSRMDEAERWFRRALEADPAFARAEAGLCQVAIVRYERTRATEHVYEAEAACRAALDADPTLRETEMALGKLYLASGRHEQAEAVYRALLRRLPRDADVRIGLGWALARSRRPADAEQSFREAVVVEPAYWLSYNALGSFLFTVGRYGEAADAYARVTELAPGNPSGFNNLGAARLSAGQLVEAANAFEQSNRIEPSRSAYSNLGTVYYYQRRYSEAEAMFTRALDIAPEDFQLWSGRADTRWHLPDRRELARQDYRRAAALAERALAVDATAAETWAILGFAYGRLDDSSRSTRYLARALEMEADSPSVNYLVALTAADRDDREEAARLVKRAIELGQSRVLVAAEPAFEGITID
ncbi:MAG: tetratricopeptide repeat protein [Steroidobacteraceae bacterium]|nr:tetratricopeptide repeat protein [Steroidobacteraceae bacterium]